MPAATGGLQMLFRSDADQLHWVFSAADLDRALVAAVMNIGVIESIPKALAGAFEKQLFCNARSHLRNLWVVLRSRAVASWLVTGDQEDSGGW